MARAFEATVVSCEGQGGRHLVVLDRTAFYPTSGGQPYDVGRLGPVEVLEVAEGEGNQVVHTTTGPIEPGTLVGGEIDWARRFDHMQQHTGQHVLSAVCAARAGVATVSFHLGRDVSTIDLAREIDGRVLADLEAGANRVVWENRPVHVRFVPAAEAERLPLRQTPTRAGELRLVEIEGCDLSACGGTHVLATGMIGQIAVTAAERFRNGTRVSFVCGGRALRSHAALRDDLQASVRLLSVSPSDLPAAVERLQRQVSALGRTIGELDDELARYRAAALRETAETVGPYRVVLKSVGAAEPARLKGLAAAVTAEPGFVAVAVGGAVTSTVVVTRSADVPLDAAAVVREVAAALGGRGGGRSDAAQAGLPAPPDQVIAAVRAALSRR
jgi:alanyl-tRNA synthetase